MPETRSKPLLVSRGEDAVQQSPPLISRHTEQFTDGGFRRYSGNGLSVESRQPLGALELWSTSGVPSYRRCCIWRALEYSGAALFQVI